MQTLVENKRKHPSSSLPVQFCVKIQVNLATNKWTTRKKAGCSRKETLKMHEEVLDPEHTVLLFSML